MLFFTVTFSFMFCLDAAKKNCAQPIKVLPKIVKNNRNCWLHGNEKKYQQRGLMIQIWRKILLRIPTAKKRSQIKLQRLQKVEIWASGSLLHQINALYKRFFIKFKQLLTKLRSPFFKRPSAGKFSMSARSQIDYHCS